MKHPTALLILLLVCSWSQTVRAQAADSWVTVSPAGERFTIQLPNGHVVKSQKNSFDQFKVDGSIYTATSDGVDYTFWSLVNEGYESNGPSDNEAYLDSCADLVWESLLKPLRDQLPKSPEVASYMSYQRELESSRLPPGREYTITLGNRSGVTHFYVAGPQIYFLTALNAFANSAATQRFFNSFVLNTPGLPVAATMQADPKLFPPAASGGTDAGIGPGRGGSTGGGDQKVGGGGPSTGPGDSTDYNRVFSGREVTGKARVLSKPEPSYTESARRYSVQGTVVLRAVFSSSGQVTSIRVVKRLPHGLTQRAVAAARDITFIPASKDGHAVSMHIQLEYQFNLF
ncbi:MAG: energy transducer TonB [Pyrinomonadaceae bacterium]|nr:energy transducer TonB [Pyrinomonadaceae bacterium]